LTNKFYFFHGATSMAVYGLEYVFPVDDLKGSPFKRYQNFISSLGKERK